MDFKPVSQRNTTSALRLYLGFLTGFEYVSFETHLVKGADISEFVIWQ